jgi:hypothetical protein
VLEALVQERWDDATRQHLLACPTCSEVAAVASVLRQDHSRDGDAELPPLPGADAVWARARLYSRLHASERATLAIALVQRLAIACGIGGAILILLWKWQLLGRWLAALRLPMPGLGAAEGVANPALVLIVSGVALLLLLFSDLSEVRGQ